MRILGRYEGPHAFGFAGDRFGVWNFGAKVRSAAGFRAAAHHHYYSVKSPPVPLPIPNY